MPRDPRFDVLFDPVKIGPAVAMTCSMFIVAMT